MGVRADLLAAGVHPNALKCVSVDAVYVSGGRQEYKILQEGPYWSIRRWPRGRLPPQLRGQFLSLKECEGRLIRFLKSKDKWGKAIYPGKEPDGKS
jgi:hypothetical protein